MIAHPATIAQECCNAGCDYANVQSGPNVLEEVLRRSVTKEISAPEHLAGTVPRADKDALAWEYVSLAIITKAPSLNLHSLFGATAGGVIALGIASSFAVLTPCRVHTIKEPYANITISIRA